MVAAEGMAQQPAWEMAIVQQHLEAWDKAQELQVDQPVDSRPLEGPVAAKGTVALPHCFVFADNFVGLDPLPLFTHPVVGSALPKVARLSHALASAVKSQLHQRPGRPFAESLPRPGHLYLQGLF